MWTRVSDITATLSDNQVSVHIESISQRHLLVIKSKINILYVFISLFIEDCEQQSVTRLLTLKIFTQTDRLPTTFWRFRQGSKLRQSDQPVNCKKCQSGGNCKIPIKLHNETTILVPFDYQLTISLFFKEIENCEDNSIKNSYNLSFSVITWFLFTDKVLAKNGNGLQNSSQYYGSK